MANDQSADVAAWTERLFPATAMPDRDWWRSLWPDPARVVAALGIESGMSVIDLGCGDGYLTAAIAGASGPEW